MLAAAILLLIPLLAMLFTNEMKWTAVDFVASGVLLFGTGLICEFAMRKVTKMGPRIAVCAGILVVMFLVWAELAVGLFGTPFAGN